VRCSGRSKPFGALGTAYGVITLPDSSTVGVSFAAINAGGGAGNLAGVQTSGGTNFWSPDTPYISAEVENAPPTPDILQLQGGQNQIYQVTLSEPIRDPIMAIVSLGQPAVTTSYEFDAPFAIVSQGAGYWGGNATALVALPNNVLQGTEGHGTIRFMGTFATFSWTVPVPEYWHGFTFGIRTTERIEPSDAGVSDASIDDVGEPDASEDAGELADASPPPDTGVGADSGTIGRDADVGRPDASSPPRDAGTTGDSGRPSDVVEPMEEDEGCNCEASRSRAPSETLYYLLAAFCVVLLTRRLRRP
jgi:hypothetical protein